MFLRKNRKRDRQRAAAMLLIICLLLAGCGNKPAEQPAPPSETGPEEPPAVTEPAARQEPLALRCALSVPYEHPKAQAMFQMEEALEKSSAGLLRIDISTDGALAETDEAALEKVINGQMEMALVSSAALSTVAPDLAVFSVPFQIDSIDHLQRVLTSNDPVFTALNAETETAGVSVLSAFASLPTGFFLRDPVPEDPDAWSGLRIAVRDSASCASLSAAGAVLLDLPESAVYPALMTGELDGAEGDMLVWLQDMYYTVAPYYVNFSLRVLPDLLIINSGTMEKLTDADKQMLHRLADEAAASCYKETAALTETLTEQAEEYGAVILEANLASFRKLFAEEFRTMRESSPAAEALAVLLENTR